MDKSKVTGLEDTLANLEGVDFDKLPEKRQREIHEQAIELARDNLIYKAEMLEGENARD